MHLYSIRVEPPYVLSQISGQKRQLNVDLADRPTCAVGLRSRKQCLAPCLEFSKDLDEFVANISALLVRPLWVYCRRVVLEMGAQACVRS